MLKIKSDVTRRMGACMLGAFVRRNFLGRRIGTLGDLEQLHYLSTEFLDFAAEYADLDSFLVANPRQRIMSKVPVVRSTITMLSAATTWAPIMPRF